MINRLKQIFGESEVKPTHSITDDSGFLAIIDPDAYRGFVHSDWTLEMLYEHFKQQMNQRHLLIWATGLEHFWRIQVSLEPIPASGFREITGSIAASQGRLLLTNYESLTMAAAYPDVSLPQRHEQDRMLSMRAGLYDVRVVQRSDPNGKKPFKESINFVYQFTRATVPKDSWSQIPWKLT
jgi:hypothetical protein